MSNRKSEIFEVNFRNTYIVGDKVTKIVMSCGSHVIVDTKNIGILVTHKWIISTTGYARSICRTRSEKSVTMHRLILSLDKHKDLVCDHIDRDKLNNTESNLRLCTKRQNNMNSKPKSTIGSTYKGVSKSYQIKKPWRARIMVNGKEITAGCFSCEVEAAKAYNELARKYFGEFAYLNEV